MRVVRTVFPLYSRVAESCWLMQKFLPSTAFGRQPAAAQSSSDTLTAKNNLSVENDTSSAFLTGRGHLDQQVALGLSEVISVVASRVPGTIWS